MLRLQPLEQPHGEPSAARARSAAARAVVGARWRQQWRWQLRRRRRGRAVEPSDGGGDGGRVAAAVPAAGGPGGGARGRPGACAAVCDPAAARWRRAHDVHAGGDGDRAAAPGARGHGRRRHCAAATAPCAGPEQVSAAVHGAGAGRGGRAATVPVSAPVLRAAGASLSGAPIASRGDDAVPLGQSAGVDARVGLDGDGGARARVGFSGGHGSAPQHAHADAGRGAGDGHDHGDTVPRAAVRHGSGAPGGDHELATRLGLVLRGPLVAGERGRAASHGARDLPGARLFGSALPLLPERADGTWPHQHPTALRVRQLPPGRRTPPRAPHAALRLRREARRILRRTHAQPQPEQTAGARQGTSVGGRARPDVLAHPAAKSPVQEAAVAQPAASRAPRHQQAGARGGTAHSGGSATPSLARTATDIRSRVPLHVLNPTWLPHRIAELLAKKLAPNTDTGSLYYNKTHGQTRSKTAEYTRVKKFETLGPQLMGVGRTWSVLHSLILELLVLQRQCYNLLVL